MINWKKEIIQIIQILIFRNIDVNDIDINNIKVHNYINIKDFYEKDASLKKYTYNTKCTKSGIKKYFWTFTRSQ